MLSSFSIIFNNHPSLLLLSSMSNENSATESERGLVIYTNFCFEPTPSQYCVSAKNITGTSLISLKLFCCGVGDETR